jgi:hypothetical protein
MFNIQEYFDRLIDFTEDDAKKEIQDLSEEMGLDRDYYTILLGISGYNYLIEKMAAKVYLARVPICETLRQKLLILNIILDTNVGSLNILQINNRFMKVKKDCWEYSTVCKNKEKVITELKKIIDLAYKNCLTCADHPNGCKGEDTECCAPEYKDWRESDSSRDTL